MKDDRFGAIYDSYHYNIDPSAPEYKKTKSMEAIIEEKLHRRKSGKTAKAGGASGQKRKAEMDKNSAGQSAKFSKSDSESISSLINSVKSKTQTFHSTKKKKWYSFFSLDTGCFICVLKHGSFDVKMIIIISVYLITLFVCEEISEFFLYLFINRLQFLSFVVFKNKPSLYSVHDTTKCWVIQSQDSC